MPSVFEKRAVQPQGSVFEKRSKKNQQSESFGKSSLRTAYQIPSGIAQSKTYPLDLLQMAGVGHALDPEEIEHLRKIHEREGIPFNEEKYREQVQQAGEYFPTQGNIERILEEKTGAPLQAKNKLQKSVKLGSLVSKLTPGSLLQKGTAGISAPVISQTAQALGVPEPISDILGTGIGSIGSSKIPGKLSVGTSKKQSGLTERRFEKLSKPKQISDKKISQINEKIENEFRDIANNIIEKSPIEETYSSLKKDIGFKNIAEESFRDVEKLSEQLTEKFSPNEISKEIVNQAFKKKGTGITPSEYEKSHQKFVKDFMKKIPREDFTFKNLVEQFRKNNKARQEAYEPGQSFAHNRAKRQALTDYNNAIASLIEKKVPNSEFANLFSSTNKRWSQIMDAEAIDKFMDKLFEGKIKFEKGKEFFDKQGMTIPFKRALGEKGFNDFEQLMKDLMSYEQASKLMKTAESKGFTNLAKTGLAYVVHPKLGTTKFGIDIGKATYKKIYESLLDKPQLSIKWDKGVNAFKKGNFKEAEKIFNELEKEIK